MKPTQRLRDLGQSLWLDSITRPLLSSGSLKRYIEELSVTGLTSNPTIFDHAVTNSTEYDAPIREKRRDSKTFDPLFVKVARENITCPAVFFRPSHDRT